MRRKSSFGTKKTCESCSADYFDLNDDGMACPMCGATPEVAFAPDAALKVPQGMLDQLIDDGLDILGEPSFETDPLQTGGQFVPLEPVESQERHR